MTKDTPPLISVIIPVYKVEPYLHQCVDSILDQTFRDFEIILVDDGSPDKCPAICDEYEKQDNRIKVIHKDNGGLSDARNSGIKNSTGKYLIFVDSDDYLVSNECLGKLADNIKNTYYNLYFLNNVVSDNSELIANIQKPEILDTAHFVKNCSNNKYKRITAWTWACKRTFIIKNNLFFYKGIYHEDEEWFPRLILSLKKSDKILVNNDNFYFYRLNRKGAITDGIKNKNIKDKLFIIDQIIKLEENLSLSKETQFQKNFLRTRAAQIMRFILVFGKNIYQSDDSLFDDVKKHYIVLRKSPKLKHRLYYVLLMVGLR